MSKIALQANRRTKSKLTLVALSSGPAAPTFRSQTTNVTTGATDITPSSPAGSVAGDFLIGYMTAFNGGSLSMVAAGGQTWTEITAVAAVGQFRCWYCVHNGTLGTVTFRQANSNGIWGGLIAYTGVNVSTPLDVTSTVASGGVSNSTVPAITTVTNHCRRVIIGRFNGDRATNLPLATATPAGVTVRDHEGYDFVSMSNFVGDIDQAVAGTSPSETFTHSVTDRTLAHIALRPA